MMGKGCGQEQLGQYRPFSCALEHAVQIGARHVRAHRAARVTMGAEIARLRQELAAAEHAAEQARADAQAAQDAAEAIARADHEARRARGLLARLRAAWRGD